MVGYIFYHGKEPCVNNEKRPDGMMVVQQQGMEVLGVNLSPSVSFKDRALEVYLVMLNAASHIVGRISRSDCEAE